MISEVFKDARLNRLFVRFFVGNLRPIHGTRDSPACSAKLCMMSLHTCIPCLSIVAALSGDLEMSLMELYSQTSAWS